MRRGFPVHVAAEKAFRDQDDVVFVNLHGVAEHHKENTFELAVRKARAAGSRAAVLEDARIDAMGWSEMWRLYRPRWSPWTVVIDRKGRVAYNGDTPRKGGLEKIIHGALKDR